MIELQRQIEDAITDDSSIVSKGALVLSLLVNLRGMPTRQKMNSPIATNYLIR